MTTNYKTKENKKIQAADCEQISYKTGKNFNCKRETLSEFYTRLILAMNFQRLDEQEP